MGLSLLSRNRSHLAPPVNERALQERFGAHFPRLFAYARTCVDDDVKAGEIVVEAFCRAFVRCSDIPDSEFRLVLFGLARGLCRAAASGKGHPDDSLNPREREVLSLLFDAQLSRREIGRLLKVKEHAVTGALVGGLKKLNATPPATLATQLRLS